MTKCLIRKRPGEKKLQAMKPSRDGRTTNRKYPVTEKSGYQPFPARNLTFVVI